MKKKYFIVAASLAIVLLLALFFFPRKSIPRNDADLQFLRPTVSSNENAFYLLQTAGEEVHWPESDAKNILNWDTWDEKLAEELLTENQHALELSDAAFLRPQFRVPAIQNFVEDFDYLGSWKNVSRLILLRALATFRQGQEEEAFESALRVVEFGHQIEDSGGVPIHFLVGSAVKSLALQTVRDMTDRTELPCEVLQKFRIELDHFYANLQGLSNAIKLEYQLQALHVDDMAKNMGLTNGSRPYFFFRQFNPAETKQKFADDARTKLNSIPQFYSDILTNGMSAPTNPSIVKLFLSGNAVGNVLADIRKNSDEP